MYNIFHMKITPEYMNVLCIYSHKKATEGMFSKLQP